MTDPEISARADALRAEAAELPSTDQIRELAAAAVARGGTGGMSQDQVREIADRAVRSSEEMTALLQRLSELLREPSPEGIEGDS